MIRAHRVNATAQDDASLISGWNIAPNLPYILRMLPGAVSCGVFLHADDGTLIASGAALAGTDQPCVLLPQTGQAIGMVDADLGWHLLVTTIGTESQREIRINPAVDLPDEIHPVYGADDLAAVRATASIDAAAHYVDDITVTCPLGLGCGLGDVVSVPVDGVELIGQVDSFTWTASPGGATEQAVIRRHVAIAPDAWVDPTPPDVADDTATATHLAGATGNVLGNDAGGLTVVAVGGLTSNVGMAVDGENGGLFTINADGSWIFDPAGDFALLSGTETAETSITYHASDGTSEALATLTVTVSHANSVPVAVDDTGATTADATTSGNVLTNDTDADADSLIVSQVSGSAGNVGVAVAGSSGGLFTIGSDGAWTFDPDSDFDSLTGDDTATTSVTYHISDGVSEDEGTLTVIVSAVEVVLGLELIGTSTASGGSSSYSVAIPAGALPGDLVIVVTGCARNADIAVGVVSPTDYTEIAELYAVDGYPTNLSVNFKILGPAPETSITVAGSGSVDWGSGTTIMVWRGADQATPLDVTRTVATGINSLTANPPAITPVTEGAVVVACGAWAWWGSRVAPGFPAGYDNAIYAQGGPDGLRMFTAAMCSKVWGGSGAEDPPSFAPESTALYTTNSSWAAVTLAIRPA